MLRTHAAYLVLIPLRWRCLFEKCSFLFFPRDTLSNGCHTPFETLLRSDRRAIQCVSSALRVEADDEEENLLGLIIDLENDS
jgi:hypothetical protein